MFKKEMFKIVFMFLSFGISSLACMALAGDIVVTVSVDCTLGAEFAELLGQLQVHCVTKESWINAAQIPELSLPNLVTLQKSTALETSIRVAWNQGRSHSEFELFSSSCAPQNYDQRLNLRSPLNIELSLRSDSLAKVDFSNHMAGLNAFYLIRKETGKALNLEKIENGTISLRYFFDEKNASSCSDDINSKSCKQALVSRGFLPDAEGVAKFNADIDKYNQIGASIFYQSETVLLPLGVYEIAAVVLLKSGERALYKGPEFEVKLPTQPLRLGENTPLHEPKTAELCTQQPVPPVLE